MHPDLLIALKFFYQPNNYTFADFNPESESQDYGASRFALNGKRILFRVGKITPTKNGEFVTLWKRIDNGPIMPFDMIDQFDFCIISVRSNEKLGQYVFPKALLHEKGIISKNGIGGKRALRVYPPWDTPESKQAAQTQRWQTTYFIHIERNNATARQAALKIFVSTSELQQ